MLPILSRKKRMNGANKNWIKRLSFYPFLFVLSISFALSFTHISLSRSFLLSLSFPPLFFLSVCHSFTQQATLSPSATMHHCLFSNKFHSHQFVRYTYLTVHLFVDLHKSQTSLLHWQNWMPIQINSLFAYLSHHKHLVYGISLFQLYCISKAISICRYIRTFVSMFATNPPSKWMIFVQSLNQLFFFYVFLLCNVAVRIQLDFQSPGTDKDRLCGANVYCNAHFIFLSVCW